MVMTITSATTGGCGEHPPRAGQQHSSGAGAAAAGHPGCFEAAAGGNQESATQTAARYWKQQKALNK